MPVVVSVTEQSAPSGMPSRRAVYGVALTAARVSAPADGSTTFAPAIVQAAVAE